MKRSHAPLSAAEPDAKKGELPEYEYEVCPASSGAEELEASRVALEADGALLSARIVRQDGEAHNESDEDCDSVDVEEFLKRDCEQFTKVWAADEGKPPWEFETNGEV